MSQKPQEITDREQASSFGEVIERVSGTNRAAFSLHPIADATELRGRLSAMLTNRAGVPVYPSELPRPFL